MRQETRNCQNCKKDFLIEEEDFAFYEKIQVPPPTWCPKCRMQRRMMFRNTYFLYKRKSDFSGEMIFSGIADDAPVKVYTTEEWMSDKWDPMSYGRDIDFSRPFLAQVLELSREIPWRARAVVNLVNSDYANNAGNCRNCYLCFNADYDENSAYSNGISHVKECFDVSHAAQSENCYQSFWLTKCSRVFFSTLCEDSYDVYFSKGLRGCHDCFGCVNLTNKKYCIFNEQYTKEEYERKIAEFNLSSFAALQALRERAKEFSVKFPWKYQEGTKNVQCTGEYVTNSKNVRDGYLIREGEDARYCQYFQSPPSIRDSYDNTSFGNGAERCYESMQIGWGAYGLICCLYCWTDVKNLRYCLNCLSTSDSFGSIGLRNKQYCILNKQYTKEEYEHLVPQVIAHMNAMPYVDTRGKTCTYGELFPVEFSPYAYNQTVAQEHLPLSKEQALAAGYRWRDSIERGYAVTIAAEDLPDSINAVRDDILQAIIGCSHAGACRHQCTLAFRVIDVELQFYRANHLALPRLCPTCRREERFEQKSQPFLTHRSCACVGAGSKNGIYANATTHTHGDTPCSVEFETSYAPDRPEIVYCEACYNAEVA